MCYYNIRPLKKMPKGSFYRWVRKINGRYYSPLIDQELFTDKFVEAEHIDNFHPKSLQHHIAEENFTGFGVATKRVLLNSRRYKLFGGKMWINGPNDEYMFDTIIVEVECKDNPREAIDYWGFSSDSPWAGSPCYIFDKIRIIREVEDLKND